MPPQYLHVAHCPSVIEGISKWNSALAEEAATPPMAAIVRTLLVGPKKFLRPMLVLLMVVPSYFCAREATEVKLYSFDLYQ